MCFFYFRNASLTNPGYLPVKATGTALENLVTTPGALYITRQAGPKSATAVSMVMSALSDYSSGYDRTVAEWMDKPQDEIEQNRVYRELRRQGIPEHKARFMIGHTLGQKQAQVNALVGALRSYATSLFAGMARTGEEGAGTLIGQDTVTLRMASMKPVSGRPVPEPLVQIPPFLSPFSVDKPVHNPENAFYTRHLPLVPVRKAEKAQDAPASLSRCFRNRQQYRLTGLAGKRPCCPCSLFLTHPESGLSPQGNFFLPPLLPALTVNDFQPVTPATGKDASLPEKCSGKETQLPAFPLRTRAGLARKRCPTRAFKTTSSPSLPPALPLPFREASTPRMTLAA